MHGALASETPNDVYKSPSGDLPATTGDAQNQADAKRPVAFKNHCCIPNALWRLGTGPVGVDGLCMHGALAS